MPYQKTPFTPVPILGQHSKPVTCCFEIDGLKYTNNLLRITLTIFGSNMRTALHAWLALNTHMFTAHFICGPKCPALFVIRYILWNNVQEENLELFWSERSKTIDQEEEKTENKFTCEEGLREENDAQLPNSKPRNLQTNGWMITKSHKNCPQKQAKYFSPKCVDDSWHWRPSLKKVWLGCGLQGMEQWKQESQNLNHLPLFML